MHKISIVIPVYGCSSCLVELYIRLKKIIEPISRDFEIIMVNDSSPDNAWKTILEICQKDHRIKGINLSRNFGQHYAITAGLEKCNGEWVVVMDCDLQDRPEEIIKLYDKSQEGWDIVFAQRINRKDGFLKRYFSKLFYSLLGYLTNTDQDASIANFGIYNRKVTDAIKSMGDYQRYFPTMVKWVGFSSTKLPVEHAHREEGKSSYTFGKLVRLAMDVILCFSDKPLRLTVKFGFVLSSLAILFALFNLVLYFKGNINVPGYTSIIVSVWFLSGLIITLIGIVGLYIGKTFDKVKGRPTYIINESVNIKEPV
jgi:polyisoprenyl-phosphate glycosyltransferase